MAIQAVVGMAFRFGVKQVVKEGGEKAAKEAVEKFTKEFLDKTVDKVLTESGKKAAQEALQKLFTNGGGAIIEKALNLLQKDLGTKAVDAISDLIKTGRFADLSSEQLQSLGKAIFKVADVAGNFI